MSFENIVTCSECSSLSQAGRKEGLHGYEVELELRL